MVHGDLDGCALCGLVSQGVEPILYGHSTGLSPRVGHFLEVALGIGRTCPFDASDAVPGRSWQTGRPARIP